MEGPTSECTSANCMHAQDKMGWTLPDEDLNTLQSIL